MSMAARCVTEAVPPVCRRIVRADGCLLVVAQRSETLPFQAKRG